MVISNLVRSWLLLVPLVPSIIVSICDLYHLLSNQALRKALNNHVIILLLGVGLIEELTDIVYHIYYYNTGTVMSSTVGFCLVWAFVAGAVYVSVFTLMAWASIERHILIFHSSWFSTKTKRYLFHYLPLCICILYPVIFYLVMFFVLVCDLPYSYNRRMCGRYGCITRNPITALWDSIAHFILPAFTTLIFSMTLFVRVIYRRYQIGQRIEWRKYRKLTIQLLPISILYITMQLPPMMLYTLYSGGLSRSIAADYYSDSLFFTYWVVLFTPFACAASLPDLQTKCQNFFLFWQRKNTIEPTTLPITRLKVGEIPPAVAPTIQ